MIGALSAYSRVYNVNLSRVDLYNRRSQPEAPVQPVGPVPTATAQQAQPAAYSERLPSEFSPYSMPMLPGSAEAEMANRARVQLPGEQAQAGVQPQTAGEQAARLPSWPGANAAEALVRMRIQYGPENGGESAETCEKRKYQDGSDDSTVSFQSPTRIDPDMVASAVRGHEMEHVAHEQAKAQQEDRKVVSQTVTLHTDICPECGKAYISGGTTRTVTKANPQPQAPEEEDPQAA